MLQFLKFVISLSLLLFFVFVFVLVVAVVVVCFCFYSCLLGLDAETSPRRTADEKQKSPLHTSEV